MKIPLLPHQNEPLVKPDPKDKNVLLMQDQWHQFFDDLIKALNNMAKSVDEGS